MHRGITQMQQHCSQCSATAIPATARSSHCRGNTAVPTPRALCLHWLSTQPALRTPSYTYIIEITPTKTPLTFLASPIICTTPKSASSAPLSPTPILLRG